MRGWVGQGADILLYTVYPKKYAQGFCFAVLCCGYTLTDFPISIRLTSLALWQSNDCPSASKATLMNMDKYFMCIHYERLHNHNKAKHNKTVCIFLGIYCKLTWCCRFFSVLCVLSLGCQVSPCVNWSWRSDVVWVSKLCHQLCKRSNLFTDFDKTIIKIMHQVYKFYARVHSCY